MCEECEKKALETKDILAVAVADLLTAVETIKDSFKEVLPEFESRIYNAESQTFEESEQAPKEVVEARDALINSFKESFLMGIVAGSAMSRDMDPESLIHQDASTIKQRIAHFKRGMDEGISLSIAQMVMQAEAAASVKH